ncbi:MAG: hypothetical protein FJ112_08790 [Deltaproteobacteria bacterium]|nr:hypothetical protein [Deltaproteobacteria bacterium]
MKSSKMIEAINRTGALLVFPIQNRKEPKSLWSKLFPRSQMRWEWDDDGDNRVAQLWHLREELSRSGQVVYSKWYRGRATFFSKAVFTNLLAVLGKRKGLSKGSLSVLETLEEESPLSTKSLKQKVKLQGRAFEGTYLQCLKPLWTRGLIVGYGEIDEGAFPSLAMGATQLIFEDLWNRSQKISESRALETLQESLEGNPLVFSEILKQAKFLGENKLKLKQKSVILGKDLYLD